MPSKVLATHRSASFVGSDRVFFGIKSNKYRLVVRVDYWHGLVDVRSVGIHAQYDTIKAEEV